MTPKGPGIKLPKFSAKAKGIAAGQGSTELVKGTSDLSESVTSFFDGIASAVSTTEEGAEPKKAAQTVVAPQVVVDTAALDKAKADLAASKQLYESLLEKCRAQELQLLKKDDEIREFNLRMQDYENHVKRAEGHFEERFQEIMH